MALLLVSLQKSTDNWEIVFVQSKYLEYVTDNNRSYSRWAGVFGWILSTPPPTHLLPMNDKTRRECERV